MWRTEKVVANAQGTGNTGGCRFLGSFSGLIFWRQQPAAHCAAVATGCPRQGAWANIQSISRADRQLSNPRAAALVPL